MSAFPSPRTRSVVVTRLRAAGCVFAEDEAALLIAAARTPVDLAAMVDRRAAGVPLEHVLGWAEFCGLRVEVDAAVFVPRRRTELLVRRAAVLGRQVARRADRVARRADHVAGAPGQAARAGAQVADPPGPVARAARRAADRPRVVVVDLCCGSGAVGIALVAALDRVELHAVDLDPAAVLCARRNVSAGVGQVYEGDLYEPLPATLRGRVDILVANAPYVPTEAIGLLPQEARIHEPRMALDGGADGLDILRRVIVAAPQWLAPGGHLLVETSQRQAPRLAEIAAGNGLITRVASSAELNATVVVATRPLSSVDTVR